MDKKGYVYIEVLISITILAISALSLLEGFRLSYIHLYRAKNSYNLFKVAQMLENDIRGQLLKDSSFLMDNNYAFSPRIAEKIAHDNILYNIFIKKIDGNFILQNELGNLTQSVDITDAYLISNTKLNSDTSHNELSASPFYNCNVKLSTFETVIDDNVISRAEIIYNPTSEDFKIENDSSTLDVLIDENNLIITQRYLPVDDNKRVFVYIDLKDLIRESDKFNIIMENQANIVLDVVINKRSNFNIITRNRDNGYILINSGDIKNYEKIEPELYLVQITVSDDNNNNSLSFLDIVRKGMSVD